jgi:toxin ParE1/3/4
MTRLVITPSAAADLDDIFHYITNERPQAAIDLLDRLEAASRLIAGRPGLGRARPELGLGLRSHAVGTYLILYRAEPGRVLIVR